MANRKMSSRMQQKADTSANWNLATTFVPLKGEVIVYTDLKKVKVGDGETTVGNLPFITAQSVKSKSTITMAASAWTSGTYSFETYYPSSKYNLEIELDPSATTVEAKAFGKAIITGNASTNVVKALGTVPTIDIPIILTVEEK